MPTACVIAELDIEAFADQMVTARQQRIAEDLARWRSWLATSLDETLALTDAQLPST